MKDLFVFIVCVISDEHNEIHFVEVWSIKETR